MDFDLQFYLVAAIVVLLTGISKSGFGAGVEMMAVPVLSLMILPQTAAAIMLPILMAIDLANLWRYRNDWQKRLIYLLVPAALIGIAIGTLTFRYLTPEYLKLGLGLLTLAFVLQRVLISANGQQRKPGFILKIILGAMAGFTSFVAHAGGPPSKIVLLSENLSNRQFVGTNSYLFGSINFLKLFPYFYLGQFSGENLTTSASLAPFVLIGVPLGFWLNGIVSQVWFTRIVFVALTLAGLKLTWDGLVYLV